MQQDSPNLSHRMRSVITLCLMAVGLVLLFFGANKAISQSDDKRYVEGIRQRIRQVRAAGLSAVHGNDTPSQKSLLNSVQASEQQAPEDADKPKENKPKAKTEEKRPAQATPAPHSTAAAKANLNRHDNSD